MLPDVLLIALNRYLDAQQDQNAAASRQVRVASDSDEAQCNCEATMRPNSIKGTAAESTLGAIPKSSLAAQPLMPQGNSQDAEVSTNIYLLPYKLFEYLCSNNLVVNKYGIQCRYIPNPSICPGIPHVDDLWVPQLTDPVIVREVPINLWVYCHIKCKQLIIITVLCCSVILLNSIHIITWACSLRNWT